MEKHHNTSPKVASHIQMPKLFLKRFQNQSNHFFYFRVPDLESKCEKHPKGFIGTNGTAKSINTEYGYYLEQMEKYFNDRVESPLARALAFIDKLNLHQDCISIPKQHEDAIKGFAYALIARDPVIIRQARKSSVFFQFSPDRDQHNLTPYESLQKIQATDLLNDYTLCLTLNNTAIPFVLPICGIYGFQAGSYMVFYLPISPFLAISFLDANLAADLHCKNDTLCRELIKKPETVQHLNEFAFQQQCKRNWGYVICPEREELDRLTNKFFGE